MTRFLNRQRHALEIDGDVALARSLARTDGGASSVADDQAPAGVDGAPLADVAGGELVGDCEVGLFRAGLAVEGDGLADGEDEPPLGGADAADVDLLFELDLGPSGPRRGLGGGE